MLINCSYNPHKAELGNHLTESNSFLAKHSTKYEEILILSDFNVGMIQKCILSEVYNLKTFDKTVKLL